MSVLRLLDRWLMAPMSATRIGVLRFVLCFYLLLDRVNGDLRTCFVSMKRPLLLMDPALALHFPFDYPLPPSSQTALVVLLNVAALFSALGLLTRLALPSFALMYLYVCSINSSWGFFNHTPAIAVQVLIVLAIAPGATAYSLDRLILWWWRRRRATSVTGPTSLHDLRVALRGPPVPSYAFHAVVAVMVAVYLATGVAKLRFSGPEWLAGETLGFSLSKKNNHHQGQLYIAPTVAAPEDTWRDGFGLAHWVYRASGSRIGRWVSDVPALVMLLAVFTMLFEMTAPLALVGPRARTIYFLCALLFHIGILVLMRIPFTVWMVIDVCLIDWRIVLGWLKRPLNYARAKYSRSPS